MRQKLFVAALLAITAAYCWGLGWIAWGFFRAGGAVGTGLAVGVMILLVLTVWVTWREVLFGIQAAHLTRLYAASGARAPEARSDRHAEFEHARTAIHEHGEDDWRAWYRLALAYDTLRDRRGARMATRRAIAEHRHER